MYDFEIFNYYVTPLFIFSIFLIASLKLGKIFRISYKISLFLLIWHTVFCLFYMWFVLNFGGDSNHYYYNAIGNNNIDFNFGTSFIILITRFLNKFLGLSYIDQFLIHGFIGYIGLLAFAGAVKEAIYGKDKYIKIIGWGLVLLPSVSFWTSGLGKDAISFMATGLALWAALDFRKRKILMFFSIFSMFMVRPHIGALLALAFLVTIIFDKRTEIYTKIFLSFISLFLTVILIPIVLRYIGLGDIENISEVNQYVDERQNSNLSGGSSLDISSMSLPMQMLSYLIRPLPFEAHNIFSLLASLDNMVLLILFILGTYSYINKRKPSVEANRFFIWIYFFLALTVLSMTTANLGIAMRQKWMFLPFLIFLLLSVIGKVQNHSPRKIL